MEAYYNNVDDRPIKLGGRQHHIITPEGYVFPLSIINGLRYYLKMRRYSQHEYDTLTKCGTHDLLILQWTQRRGPKFLHQETSKLASPTK